MIYLKGATAYEFQIGKWYLPSVRRPGLHLVGLLAQILDT